MPSDEEARALTQQRLGDKLIADGDLVAALVALRAELALRRRIAAADPADVEKRRQVERVAARTAEVLVLKSAMAACGDDGRAGTAPSTLSAAARALEKGGDLGGALAFHRESLALRRRLAAQNPEDVAWALDVAWSLMAVGDALAEKGDHVGALAALREALAIRSARLAADAENDGLRCDAAASLTRIGDVLVTSGDRTAAAASYREARALAHELVARAPERAEWREDLAAIEERLAELAPGV